MYRHFIAWENSDSWTLSSVVTEKLKKPSIWSLEAELPGFKWAEQRIAYIGCETTGTQEWLGTEAAEAYRRGAWT